MLRGKDAAKGDRTPYFSVVLEHGEGEESLSLSLTEISAIQTRLALRVPSGLSPVCPITLVERGSCCPENGLSLIVIIFLTGSRLDLTRYNDRDFGFWSRTKQKVVPFDRDICRPVPIWIQIYAATSFMLMGGA